MKQATKPLVSVVMAVLNPHPVYFPQAVQSVMQQTLEDLELLIIEEPSPRSAKELLVGLNDPRIRHRLDLQRTSVGEQRNRGVAQARADLVALLDADDICEPDRLEKQVDYLRAHPETDVLGSQLCIINAFALSRFSSFGSEWLRSVQTPERESALSAHRLWLSCPQSTTGCPPAGAG